MLSTEQESLREINYPSLERSHSPHPEGRKKLPSAGGKRMSGLYDYIPTDADFVVKVVNVYL